MSWAQKARISLRARLFLVQLLIGLVSVATLLAATLVLTPSVHDRLMAALLGTSGHTTGDMTAMAQATERIFQESMLKALMVGTGAGVLATAALSLFVSARIVGPLRRLLAASRRIAAGHYTERVPTGGGDEIGALAAQFNHMAAELESVERRRVALIGDVAHELRTPLATMEGYTEGLLDGIVAPEPATWALLHDEVRRLRRLVHDLQDLSRAEAHQLPIELQPVAIADLLARAERRLTAQFDEKEVALICGGGPGAVMADADRMLQVLINLLGNALRATQAGGSVRLWAEHDHEHVTVHVADSGVGIAAEHLPHIFERFYRVDKARSRALGGSGIGLTIARAIVEAHGGRLWVTSPGLGQGATFSFSLPAALTRRA